MEQVDNPLGLIVLEVADTVAGYPKMDQATKDKLMESEVFSELVPSLRGVAIGHMSPTPSSLVANVDESVLIVTDGWVVSIQGETLSHCVDVLIKYRNVVAMQLGTTVTGEMRTPIVENPGPLVQRVARQQRRGARRQRMWQVGLALMGLVGSGVIGFLIAKFGG